MMQRFLFAVFLVVAWATVAVAASIEEAEFAYDRGDYTQAARLFRPLAEQGIASAQFNLGMMYAKGLGARQDFILAHMWSNIAAATLNGDEGKSALTRRDHVASQMTAAQIEKAQEMARRCQDTKFKECE